MNLNNFDEQANYKAVDNELCSISDPIQPDKFDGNIFCIWKQEMELYLTHLKLDKHLTEDKPVNHVANTDVFNLASQKAWFHGDYMCIEVILDQLIEPFYALYSQKKRRRRCGYHWRRNTKHMS
ncbi:hypothetical protein N665_0516s0024 [Sinapis alba]|nr:hypothetical protein N665_0516s0024 [Sinapis alba]